MKTNLLFIALGAALMFAVLTLLETNSVSESNLSSAKNEERGDIGTPLSASDQIPQVNTVEAKNESDINPLESGLSSQQNTDSAGNGTPNRKTQRSHTPEYVKIILARASNRRAKRFLKKAIGSTNPKLDTLQSFAEIKLRADEQHQNESNIFTDSVNISIFGRDATELTSEQQELIDQWGANRQQLNTNLESNRQTYEDSLRNLLNPQELEQYRIQESLIADQFFDTSVESLTELYRESISDLNDYQQSQLDKIIEQAQALEPARVPIGSILDDHGYSSYHNELANSKRYTNVSEQIESILSDQQRAHVRKHGLQFVYSDIK